jgi:4-hydroxybenzoate polyprenyltransferase
MLRPHQWAKNVLIFVPLLLSHRPGDIEKTPDLLLAFVLFCLCASAGYIVNDLRDLEADRHHPLKRHRPLASGSVPTGLALTMAGALLLIAFLGSAWLLPWAFTATLAAYVLFALLYSLWIKTRLLVDVFVLAGLYTLRLLAGGAAAEIELTAWLLAFSMFLFLSLALAKRYAELDRAPSDQAEHLKARNYRRDDMAVMLAAGLASGYLAVLVMAIYISSDLAQELYRRPELLWLVCPVMLYWITRVWFLPRRGALQEDPILFALKDRVSWIAGIVAVTLVVLAAVLV